MKAIPTLDAHLQDTPRNRHLVDALSRLVETEVATIVGGGSIQPPRSW